MTPDASAPLAVVGIACRFPGAHGPAELWRRLCEGYDAIGQMPAARFAECALDPAQWTDKSYTTGGFLPDIDRFDPTFFGVAPREARRMDPQQRLLLETVWETLDDAGIPPEQAAGTKTGIFVGEMSADYWDLQQRATEIDLHAVLSSARSLLSGRLSHTFDLRGPSMSLDTGCSSALLAVHLAARSLRSGESTLALAGGVNLILTPHNFPGLSRAGVLAADGRCKFGDAAADGYVRSEGVGLVALKRLDQARKDNDRVYAVLLGSATNNDGTSSDATGRPAVEGQTEMLRSVLADAGVRPADVDYVEAHGAGTAVGDPAELRALGSVLGEGRSHEHPLLVGSVKTNLGHTESAAGIAGFIKTVLCLYHGMVPPNLHLRKHNPAVDWERLPLHLPTELGPLPPRDRAWIAGVHSLGLSGSNAHTILTQAEAMPPAEPSFGPRLLTLSSHTPETLREVAEDYVEFLGENGAGRGLALDDLCYTASVRRQHQAHRLAVTGRSPDEIVNGLRSWLDTTSDADAPGRSPVSRQPRPVVFVFSGQGSQWIGMGRALLEAVPAFRTAIEHCDQAVRAEAGWSVLERLTGDLEADSVETVQPTLWAVQVALAAVWRAYGIEPDTVIGHSMGEVAAAHVAGALSLRDAAAVIVRRSRLAARIGDRGAMASVMLSEQDTAEALNGYSDRVSIAASNGPHSTVLSGDPAALEEILSSLEQRDVFCRRIDVTFAAHSPQVDALRDELRADLADITPRAGTVPIHSTVLDEVVDGSGFDAEYWVRNLREPVRFAPAITTQREHDPVFLEISPHPVLVQAIDDCAGDSARPALPTARQHEEVTTLLSSLGTLWTLGHTVNFEALRTGRERLVSLPSYRWLKERCWITFDQSRRRPAAPAVDPGEHPLLGSPVASDGPERIWEGPLDRARNPYLDHHKVQGVTIFPGAGYCELLLAAARRTFGERPVSITDIELRRVLVLPDGESPTVRVHLTPEDNGTHRVEIRSGQAPEWTVHATGRARVCEQPDGTTDLNSIRARCAEHLSGADLYRELNTDGNQWHEHFQAIGEVWRGDGEALARIERPASLASGGNFQFHPVLLDACGQALAAAGRVTDAFVLGGVDEGHLYRRPGEQLWAHATLSSSTDGRSVTGDLRVLDDDGRCLGSLLGVRLHYVDGARPGDGDGWFYTPQWTPARHGTAGTTTGTWVLVADATGVADALRRKLESAGHEVVTLTGGHRLADAAPDNVHGVVHLANLDAPDADTAPAAEVARTQREGCARVAELVRDLTGVQPAPRLWLVTSGAVALPDDGEVAPLQAMVWGLGRTLAQEAPELRPTLVDVRGGDPVQRADSLYRELVGADGEDQIALRGEQRFVARLTRYHATDEPTPEPAAPRGPFQVTVERRGTLDGLAVASTPRRAPGSGEVEISTAYAALNYGDMLRLMGMDPTPDESVPDPGVECAGTVTAVGGMVSGIEVGDEVVAIGTLGLHSRTIAKLPLVFKLPPGVPLEDAATMPIVFLTAHYSLSQLAGVRPGEKVLIHTGTGGVGLAAVQIARHLGAEVFATAGSAQKRALLRTMGVRHVADSRSLDFAEEFRVATHGSGVDVVLNTLTGEAIQKNLELLVPGGRYVELTKRDVFGEGWISMRDLARNISFHVVDLESMWRADPARVASMMREVLEHLRTGAFAPLPREVFPADEASTAFRRMARAQHIGKILLSFEDEEASRPTSTRLVRSDATYLVTGGGGDLGRAVAEWLLDRGARHVLLLGRSEWESTSDLPRRPGVRYEVADVADESAVRAALRRVEDAGWPSVCGVVHAAGVGDYRPIAELDEVSLAEVMRPKVLGSLVLHRLFPGASLDFFALFSSVSAVLGSPLLGGYAGANAFLDALAQHRRLRGAAATSVNWGFWSSIGMAARIEQRTGRKLPPGMGSFTPDEGIAALETLLRENVANVAVLPIDWPEWSRAHSQAARSPLLARLVQGQQREASSPVPAPPVLPVPSTPPNGSEVTASNGAAPAHDALPVDRAARREAVTRDLVGRLAHVLGTTPERVDLQQPLNRTGLDSLMALELKNQVSAELGVSLPVVKLLGGFTLGDLIDEVVDGPRETESESEPTGS